MLRHISSVVPVRVKQHLKRRRKELKKRFMKSSSYQENRPDGTRQRWERLSGRLDPDDKSLLDVGCDIGTYTQAAACRGLVVLGIEQKEDRVRTAIRRTKGGERVAFMVLALTPENIRSLPDFDVVLFLSVYHQFVRSYGPETAQQMLMELGRKANRKLFFEPAGTRREYRDGAVGFEDMNEASIRDYHMEFLGGLFPDAEEVSYLGATECRGSEPFRTLFEVKWPRERPDTYQISGNQQVTGTNL